MFNQTFETIKYFADEFSETRPELNRITFSGISDDVTAKAYIRALLFKRLPEDKGFDIKVFKNVGCATTQVDPFSLLIFKHNTDDDSVRAFQSAHEGFEILQKHTDYLNKWIQCRIMINKDMNAACILLNDTEPSTIHMSLSLFPAFYPGLFKDAPLTQQETELCTSLTHHVSNDFLTSITALAKLHHLDTERTAFMLRNYSIHNRERAANDVRNDVSRAEDNLNSNIQEYQRLLKAYEEVKMRLEAILSHRDGEDQELVDFFAHHKNIRLVDIIDDKICIEIATEFKWFDMDYYRRVSANETVYAIPDMPPAFKDKNDRKLLMDAIFSDDPKFVVKMCAYYQLASHGDVEVERGHSFSDELKDYMPNPHLQRHACLGSHRTPIREYLRNGDILGAISQCVASAQSVNLMETNATFVPFMRDLLSSRNKVLRGANGEDYTPKQALDLLKKEAV